MVNASKKAIALMQSPSVRFLLTKQQQVNLIDAACSSLQREALKAHEPTEVMITQVRNPINLQEREYCTPQ